MPEGSALRKFARLLSLGHRETRQAVRRILEDHGVQLKLRDLLSFDKTELQILANRAEMLRNATGYSLEELGITERQKLRNYLLNEKNFNDLLTSLHAMGKLESKGYTLEGGKLFNRGSSKDILTIIRAGVPPEEVKKSLGITGMASSISKIYQRYRLNRLRHLRPDEHGAIKIQVNGSEFRFHVTDPVQLAREIEEHMKNNPEVVKALVKEIQKAHQAALAQELLKKMKIEKIKVPWKEKETSVRIDTLYRLHEQGINPFLFARAYMEAKKLLDNSHIKAFEGGTHLILEREKVGNKEEVRRKEVRVDIHGLANYLLEGFSHDIVNTFGKKTGNILETFKDLSVLQEAAKKYLEETKQRAATNVDAFDVDHEELIKAAATGVFLENHGEDLLRRFEELIEKHKEALAQRKRTLSKFGAIPDNPDELARYLKTHIRSMSAEDLDRLARILDCLESGARCRSNVTGELTERLRNLLGYRNKSYKYFYQRFGVHHSLPDDIKEETIKRCLQRHRELLGLTEAGRLRILAQEAKEVLKNYYRLKLQAAANRR